MNFDNGYLSVNILSPNSEIGLDLQNNIIEFLENTTFSILENDIINDSIQIQFYVSEIDLLSNLEDFLDGYRAKEKKIRFAINCYTPGERYPSLIRINKQLKKIRVAKKKKLMGL